MRGRLKQGRQQGDIAAIGDRVEITSNEDGSGSIEQVHDRQRALIRLDPRPRGVYQQVLLANLDQVVFVFACANPAPHLRMLDRFLVIAEKQAIPALIVANKIDLVGKKVADQMFAHYRDIGYPVFLTSAHLNLGIDSIRKQLTGRVSALAGPSGVGKSSLLNAIQPGLSLVVKDVGQLVVKGRHTTNFRQLLPLTGGGYVGDTPGLRSLALWDTQPEELDGYFPEIAHLVGNCRFNDCDHSPGTPGCAVCLALGEGRIHPERYESYLRLRAGED